MSVIEIFHQWLLANRPGLEQWFELSRFLRVGSLVFSFYASIYAMRRFTFWLARVLCASSFLASLATAVLYGFVVYMAHGNPTIVSTYWFIIINVMSAVIVGLQALALIVIATRYDPRTRT